MKKKKILQKEKKSTVRKRRITLKNIRERNCLQGEMKTEVDRGGGESLIAGNV